MISFIQKLWYRFRLWLLGFEFDRILGTGSNSKGQSVVSWRIWYENGTAFGPSHGTWNEAPIDGIVHILLFHFDGSVSHLGKKDFYWCHDFGYGKVFIGDDDRNRFMRRFPFVKWGCAATPQKVHDAKRQAQTLAYKWGRLRKIQGQSK